MSDAIPLCDRLGWSIPEFCQLYGISEPLYYKLQRNGEGPVVSKAGARTIIQRDDGFAWARSRRRAKGVAACAFAERSTQSAGNAYTTPFRASGTGGNRYRRAPVPNAPCFRCAPSPGPTPRGCHGAP